jgi:hypothetical protein
LGDYRSRILIGSLWPIVFLVLAIAVHVIWNVIRGRLKAGVIAPSARAAMLAGLQRILPFALAISFLLVPSTSTRIFKTFFCDPFDANSTATPSITRRFLHEDLNLDCEVDEYSESRNIAVVLVLVWPIGVPLLYALLILVSREAQRTGRPTTLSRATAFLSADSTLGAFMWEPLEFVARFESGTALN